MADSTLLAIQKKVRRLTASPDETQLSTDDLNEYINTTYEQDMPSSLKIWEFKQVYKWVTTPNIDKYPIDNNTFHAVEQPIFIDGYQAGYSQDRSQFFNQWPINNFQETPGFGTGALGAGPYNLQLFNIPVLPNNLTISALDSVGVEMVLQDNGSGGLIDFNIPPLPNPFLVPTPRGVANLVTGLIQPIFPRPVQIGAPIIVRAVPYVASRPVSMLYFNDYFILRPVPDKVYRVEMNVYQKPLQLINTTDVPQLDRWWQFIAYGAAIKVLQDRLDTDSIAQVYPFFQEQQSLILYHTANQRREQRAGTIYSESLNGPYDGFGRPGVSNGL